MRCSKLNRNLAAYIDGRVSSDLAVELKTHLTQCKACSARETAFRRLDSFMADEANLASDPNLSVRVKAIARARGPIYRNKRAWSPVQKALLPMTVAAGLVIGVFIGAQLNSSLQTRPTPVVDRQAGPSIIDSNMFSTMPTGSFTASYVNMTSGE